jgi:hypothetical protein
LAAKAYIFLLWHTRALPWTEAITLVCETHVPHSVYEEVCKYFNEKEILDLTFVVATINAWNRLAIALRAVPGQSSNSGYRKVGSHAVSWRVFIIVIVPFCRKLATEKLVVEFDFVFPRDATDVRFCAGSDQRWSSLPRPTGQGAGGQPVLTAFANQL